MIHNIKLGGITIEVIKKEIRNLHLNVLPPNGLVRISAPTRMDIKTIRLFAISKLSWIKKQQNQFRSQNREQPREYITRESHFLWGKRYLLQVIEKNEPPKILLQHSKIILQVRPKSSADCKRTVFSKWYRQELQKHVAPLISKWEKRLGVKVKDVTIRKMKTRWGSCNSKSGRILLNTELGKKPKSCIEYIVVHEMIHLLEHSHNKRFIALMDRHMPQWKHQKAILRRLPI